jgi:hypothetical protein
LRMLDAAHLVNIERSDEFTQILLSFLGAESPQVEVSASTS